MKHKHQFILKGSVAGMMGIYYKDGSYRPPMVYAECKCGLRDLFFEHLCESELMNDVLEIAKRFYTKNYE